MSYPWDDLAMLSRLGWSSAVSSWVSKDGEPLGIVLQAVREDFDYTVRAATLAEAMPLLLRALERYPAGVGESETSLRNAVFASGPPCSK